MKIIVTILLILFNQNVLLVNTHEADVKIIVTDGEKNIYAINDSLKIEIKVYMPPEICLDGMELTKVYISGLSILNQEDWKHFGNGIWVKNMSLVIRQNKKNESKITVTRKADKGHFFKQKKFKVHE